MVARAVTRKFSPLRGKNASHLLPRTRLGGPMPWVIAIMVALTVLTAGGGLALANLAGGARDALSGSATVQILQADPSAREVQTNAAIAVLERQDGVAELRRVPQEELEKLIEPWLGSGAQGDVVPLPALIDVRLSRSASPAVLDRLRQALREPAPSARVDAQSDWLGPVFETVSALRWLAAGLIALLAFTSAAAVWLAARNALNSNRSTIEVVHLLGGNDAQIASIFQRSVFLDALIGGLLGMILGGAALLVLGSRLSALQFGMATSAGLAWPDWALLSLIPLATVALALLTARMTVMASLGKML